MTDQAVTITIAGPKGTGKTLLAESMMFDLRDRGLIPTLQDDAPDRRKPDIKPDIVIVTVDPSARLPYETPTLERGGSLAELQAKWLNTLVADVHGRNVAAGWWTDLKTGESLLGKRNFGELLCLVHSEVSEAMEGHRKGLQDDKLPHRPMAEVELADTIIRILDVAGGFGFDLGGALVEKLAYNASRADHKPEARLAAGGKAY